jgi:membrane protein DedA with SNARE-associated domain
VTHDDTFIERHIKKIIFFSRFLVQLRFLGPFLGGTKKVPLRTFLTYELAALCIYVPLLLSVGAYFRNRLEAILEGLGTVHNIILIIIGAVILLSVIGLLRRLFLGNFILSLRGQEGYERTWIPGLHRKNTLED